MLKKIIIVLIIALFLLPGFAAADELGQSETFFTDSSFDAENREEVTASLEYITDKAYFYLEDEWYNSRSDEAQEDIKDNLRELARKFDNEIYPELTSTFGNERKPGIDDDYRITILFHSMRDQGVGYFRSGDGYEQIQVPQSNEREMFYLNIDYLYFKKQLVKDYTAHELIHLITFNQKDELRNVTEEVWLNESRADYAPTLLGYSDNYRNSNLKRRVREFLDSQSDSLLEWEQETEDYGVINAFTHYLADHYGSDVLVDSLHTDKVGIESINYALEENGFEQNFSDVFTDWTIASFLNDCEVKKKYCYKNENLKEISINPELLFLPSTGQTEISANYSIKPWSGHWYRIMGGEGDLNLQVEGSNQVDFEIPYVVCKNSTCTVDSLKMNENQRATTTIENFGEFESLTLIPSIQSEVSAEDEFPSYNFSIETSVEEKSEQEEENQRLRQRIAELQVKIDKLLERLHKLKGNDYACSEIDQSLKVGMRGEQVECLQQFLKGQDDIYPEGLITGYFGPLTKAAVVRFQERHQQQILAPWNLQKGTGYVGRTTKEQINEIMNE